MRVLFYTRKDYLINSGGDTIQLLKTKEYLERLNVKIDIVNDEFYSSNNYDLIHIFNCLPIYHVERFIKRNAGKKIIISPIYWDLTEYKEKVLSKVSVRRRVLNYIDDKKNIFLQKLKNNVYKFFNNDFEEKFRFCLNSANIILPNSQREKKFFDEKYGLNEKTFVVPNGIDVNIKPANYENLKIKYKLPDKFVLSVGRIEYRKNQLMLLQCAQKLKLNVILVGSINHKEKKYYQKLKRYNFLHIPYLNQNELFSLYNKSMMHVLPSWFETPGLATLEAAYNGAQIITTDRGCTKEYFDDFAFYCSPDNISSLEMAINELLEQPKDIAKLKEKIINNYTWEVAAKKTLEAYNIVLK